GEPVPRRGNLAARPRQGEEGKLRAIARRRDSAQTVQGRRTPQFVGGGGDRGELPLRIYPRPLPLPGRGEGVDRRPPPAWNTGGRLQGAGGRSAHRFPALRRRGADRRRTGQVVP